MRGPALVRVWSWPSILLGRYLASPILGGFHESGIQSIPSASPECRVRDTREHPVWLRSAPRCNTR